MQMCSADAMTSTVIREANNSILSRESMSTTPRVERSLKEHLQSPMKIHNGHNSDHFMSNQLIPYNNSSSPEPPNLSLPYNHQNHGALDFSFPSSKLHLQPNQHSERPQSLPPPHAPHATPFITANPTSENDVCVSPPWYSRTADHMASQPLFAPVRTNGAHLDNHTHGAEFNSPNGSTLDRQDSQEDHKSFLPHMMYATNQQMDDSNFRQTYKSEPDLLRSTYKTEPDLLRSSYDTLGNENFPLGHDSAQNLQHLSRDTSFHSHGLHLNGGNLIPELPSGASPGERRYFEGHNGQRISVDSSDDLEVFHNDSDSRYESSDMSSNENGSYLGHNSSAVLHSSHHHDSNRAATLDRQSYSSSSPPLMSPRTPLSSSSKQFGPQTDTDPSDYTSGQSGESSVKPSLKSQSSMSKSGKQTRGAQNLPPCRVCGNKASGLHFGVNTCEACNEFFRRSLKRGASYYCTKNRECQVYGKKRNACSFCRYRRCVDMGMSRDAIKTGRYSHKTRTEYAMEVEEFRQREMNRAETEKFEALLNDMVKYHDKYIIVSTRVPYDELHAKQKNYLELFNTQKEHELRHPPLSCSSMKNKRLFTCWQSEKEDLSLTMHDVEMTERWLRNYINYAKNVPGFKELALSDQASLVRGSWFEFWFLGAFRGYNSKLGIVVYPNGRCFHKEEIKKVFGQEYTDYSFYLADRMKTLDWTPEEKVLIKTVCLTFPDRTLLQNKEAVEKMHWLMVSCLLHTLERKRPGDTTIFPLIVSKLVELRTLTDIAMRAHKSALFQDVLKDSPLLCEMVDTKTHYVQCAAEKNGVQDVKTVAEDCPG